MCSLRQTRNQLFVAHYEGVINDEEFLLLFDRSENPDLPYDLYDRFDFSVLENDECVTEFRFNKEHITRLAEALRIPAQIRCYQRTVCSGLEALCILLKRLSYPCRYADMIRNFGRSVPILCMIYNHMLDLIYETHSHRLLAWNNEVLNPGALESYAKAIAANGSPLTDCFGFIDGTVRPICRPGENQRLVYNGHKRVHALKFQAVALPNGLIGNMFGPVEGKRHDSGLLRESHLLQNLQQYAFSPTPQPLHLYGDSAYPLRVHLQGPFRNVILTPE